MPLAMIQTILVILGGLIAAVLTGLAIMTLVTSSNLSLPLPRLGHGLALVLPVLSYLVLVFRGKLNQFLSKTLVDASTATTLLGLLDAVLATLAGATLAQPETLRCALEAAWLALFRAKDAPRIRAIQDAHQCCGLWSARDRAWPFPGGTHRADACLLRFDRRLACGDLWTADARFVLVVWLAIGGYGLVIKAFVALLRRRQHAGAFAMGYHGFGSMDREDRVGDATHRRYLDEPPREEPRQQSGIVDEVGEGTEGDNPV